MPIRKPSGRIADFKKLSIIVVLIMSIILKLGCWDSNLKLIQPYYKDLLTNGQTIIEIFFRKFLCKIQKKGFKHI